MPMSADTWRRLALLPLQVLAAVTLVFVMLRAIPGSSVDILTSQNTSETVREQLISEMGLDLPMWHQFLIYVGGLLRGDLGNSYITGRSVSAMLAQTLPATIELALAALMIMCVLGVGAGIVAAMLRRTPADTAIRLVATVLFSIPWFWLGILLIIVFTLRLGWLPSYGRMPSDAGYQPITSFVPIDAVIARRPDWILPWLAHLLLPSLTIGLTTAGFLTRLTRATMIDIAQSDFVRTARAKGIAPRRVVGRHILRNASVPILGLTGLQFGALLGGSVVTEVVFSFPGIGRLLVDSILQRDYAVVQGCAITLSVLFVLVNLGTDLLVMRADPRTRRT